MSGSTKLPIRVWVDSPSVVISEALKLLIIQMGFDIGEALDPTLNVVVCNLSEEVRSQPAPPLPTIAVVSHTDEGRLVELLRLGYRGYCRSNTTPAQLKRAIEAVNDGEIWAERRLIAQAFLPSTKQTLTIRQAQVLSFLRRGYTNKQIAEQLNLSEKTVKVHVSALYDRLGVKNRAQLFLHLSLADRPS